MSAKRPPTIEELAKALKVSSRTLKTWLARGCPRTSAAAIEKWRDANVLPRQGGPRKEIDRQAGPLQRRINKAKLRRELAAAKKAERENEIEAGRLRSIDDITREWAEQFAPARTLLDAFPDQFAKELPREQRVLGYDLARNMVDKVLRCLARIGTVADGR